MNKRQPHTSPSTTPFSSSSRRAGSESWTRAESAWLFGLLAAVLLGSTALSPGAAPEANTSASDLLPEQRPWDKPGSELVGDAGDLSRLEFTGNKTFTADTLRQGLLESPSYLLGSHQLAPRAAFFSLVKQKLVAGYQHSGFPEPQVTVNYDASARRVQAQITEGHRFLCGTVKTVGVNRQLSRALVKRLTEEPLKPVTDANKQTEASDETDEPKPNVHVQANMEVKPGPHPLDPQRKESDDSFLWERGTPAAFNPSTLSGLEDTAKAVLAEHGFFFPTVKVHPKLLPAKGLADLVVEVSALGPPGQLSAVDISGNQKNTAAELREFLGLKPGLRVTRASLQDAEAKLWQSGRFRFYALTPQADTNANAAPQHIRLQVKVVEFDFAPKLTEPLPERAQALLRLGTWLSGFASRPNEDAVARCQFRERNESVDLDFELTLSPSRGLLVQFRDTDSKAAGYRYSCLFMTNGVGLFAPRRASQLLVVKSNLTVGASIDVVPTAPGSEHRFNFGFGAGFRGLPDEDVGKYPPFRLKLTLAPAAFLALAMDTTNSTWRNDGKTCSLTTSNLTLRFDARSGRLGELRYQRESASVTLHFTPNEFARATRELRNASAGCRNEYQESNPLGSFLTFSVGELMSSRFVDQRMTNLTAPERLHLLQAVSRLMDTQVLQPLDPAWGTRSRHVLTNFSVPLEPDDAALGQNNMLAMFSGLIFRYGNEWFPKYSWPWTMARESVLMLGGQTPYVGPELNRLLDSDATGPLGCLTLAASLKKLGSPASQAFARRGLLRLSARDFRTDCRLLLAGDSGLAKTVANMAAVLRTMPPDEVAALVKVLPPAEAELLRQGTAALRAQPNGPLAEVLAPAFNQYWEDALRTRISACLMKLAD